MRTLFLNPPSYDDFDGGAEAFERFIAEPQRKQDEDEGIGERGEGPGAVVAVSFFAVGGALGPAHGEIGNTESGDIGKIVDGVVQKRDASAEDAAENFSDHQPESGGHGPAQHRRAKRGVGVARVGMIAVLRMTRVIVVRMRAHPHHSTHSMDAPQPSSALIRQFDTLPPRMD